MTDIKVLYAALTPEQRLVIAEKRVEGDQTPEAWLTQLSSLAMYDRHNRALQGKAGKQVALLATLTFVSFFVAITIPPGWILFLALLVATIMKIRANSSARKADLAENLRGFVLPVLAILREEMNPGHSVHLRLDLRPGTIKEKLTTQGKPYRAGRYNVTETTYVDPWMEGRARLADGSDLEWKVETHVLERKKSGKRTKFKYKQRTHLLVEVALPENRYGVGRAAAPAEGTKMMVKAGEKRSAVKLRRVIKSEGLAALHPGAFIDIVAQAYRNVTPALPAGGK